MQLSLHTHQIQTGSGSICLYAKSGVLSSHAPRPVLLLIHGVFRHSSELFQWADCDDSGFDLVFADLPGHGQSSATEDVTIAGFAAAVADAITTALGGRDVVVVGSSLGGLVALALGCLGIESVKAVVAADPPLTMAKLWHVRREIGRVLAGIQLNQFMISYTGNIFGVSPDGSVSERIYYQLIENSKVPVLVLTGDVPLFPERDVNAVPCMIDDVDRYVIERLSGNKALVQTVSGCGHMLLTEDLDKCHRTVERFAAIHTAKS